MHTNIAADSSRWTKGFVYIPIVNSIKSAAAMKMIEPWLHGEQRPQTVFLFSKNIQLSQLETVALRRGISHRQPGT